MGVLRQPALAPSTPMQLIATVQKRAGWRLGYERLELRRGYMVRPYLVKPNVEEAEEATGLAVRSEASIVAAVKHFQEAGVRNVAISLGADGLALGNIEGIVPGETAPSAGAHRGRRRRRTAGWPNLGVGQGDDGGSGGLGRGYEYGVGDGRGNWHRRARRNYAPCMNGCIRLGLYGADSS